MTKFPQERYTPHMKIIFIICITLSAFAREFNHNGFGVTLEFPDDWHLFEIPNKAHTRRTSLCTLYPFHNHSVSINFSTGPKRPNELRYYLNDNGKEKLLRATVREYERFVPNITMNNFSLLNNENGLGFEADFIYAKGNRYLHSYQRAFMGVLQYYLLTLICPANMYAEYKPLFDKISLAYPRVRSQTTWRVK
jgi:hypothetical protein